MDSQRSDIPCISPSDIQVVLRGNAPPNIFQIPDEGLCVPSQDTFLARFRDTLKMAKPVALPSGTEPQAESQNSEPFLRSESLRSSSNTNSPSDVSPSPNQPDIDHNHEVLPQLSSNSTASSAHATDNIAPNTDQNTGVDQSASGNVPARIPVGTAPQNNDDLPSKSFEEAADEEEDTLINVLPEHSLLFDGRQSYPILRFCTGNAILNQKVLDKLGVPLGFMWTPFGQLSDVQQLSRSARRCHTCSSFLTKGNGADLLLNGSSIWKCGFCGRNNHSNYGKISLQPFSDAKMYPELHNDTVEFVDEKEKSNSDSIQRGAIILIVDENLNTEEAKWAQEAVDAVHVTAIERGMRFALMKVGTMCGVATWRRGKNGDISTLQMMSPMRMKSFTATEKQRFFFEAPTKPSRDKAPSSTATSLANGASHTNVSDNIAPVSPTDAFICGRVAPFGDGNLASHVNPAATEYPTAARMPVDAESRRLDVAIAVAHEMLDGVAKEGTSRILSLITGPPTLGTTGATHPDDDTKARDGGTADAPATRAGQLWRAFDRVGMRAAELGVSLDFLVFGAPHGFAAPILLNASKRSCGGMVYCAAHSFSAGTALTDAAVFLAARSTSTGLVSIRVSGPLVVARVIGPALPTPVAHTYSVPGVDASVGFTVVLKPKDGAEAQPEELDDDYDKHHAIVQLATKANGIIRVVTARIPVVTSAFNLLSAVDAEVCAVVLAKACVVTGGGVMKPDVVASSIDATVRRLMFGSDALVGVVRLLYEIRRGTLVEERVQADQALILRSLFLRAECALASLLMSPRLFTNAMTDERTGLMAEVPLEKPYVRDDAVVVLDTGLNMFVYMGENAAESVDEAVCDSARNVAAQRTLPCQLWKLRRGRDADYVLDTYLSPGDVVDAPELADKSSKPTAGGFTHYCRRIAPDSIMEQSFQTLNMTETP